MHEYVYDDGCIHSIAIVFRQLGGGTTPGDLNSCMTLVQSSLPIALARPFVEQLVPEGTRVSIIMIIISITEIFANRISQEGFMDHVMGHA